MPLVTKHWIAMPHWHWFNLLQGLCQSCVDISYLARLALGMYRLPVSRERRSMATRASASGGKRISQNEFTEKAWQSIIAAPDIAQNASQQIVDTEHLFKALLEQPNGLARRILSKAGSNPTQLLEKTDQYIRQQPRVTGDSSQVPRPPILALCLTSVCMLTRQAGITKDRAWSLEKHLCRSMCDA